MSYVSPGSPSAGSARVHTQPASGSRQDPAEAGRSLLFSQEEPASVSSRKEVFGEPQLFIVGYKFFMTSLRAAGDKL